MAVPSSKLQVQTANFSNQSIRKVTELELHLHIIIWTLKPKAGKKPRYNATEVFTSSYLLSLYFNSQHQSHIHVATELEEAPGQSREYAHNFEPYTTCTYQNLYFLDPWSSLFIYNAVYF